MADYRHICPYGLARFVRFAANVWDAGTQGKTQEEAAAEVLERMENWTRELGLVMNIKDFGVTADMIEGIANRTFIMESGYKVLMRGEIADVLKASM